MGEAERVSEGLSETRQALRTTRRRRSGSRSVSSSSKSRNRLRVLYFSLAAGWGFLAGTVAVLVGLSAAGRPVHLGGAAGMLVAGAAVMAVVGGLVVAAGYRSASRRLR